MPTRYITDLIAERERIQASGRPKEAAIDCIQWAMDQDIPEAQRKPTDIAHRILHLCGAIIDTPIGSLVNLLYDTASYGPEYVDELREEITECLADITGMRMVTSDTFSFDDGLTFPKGATIAFPTMYMRQDPGNFPSADKFDAFRHCRTHANNQYDWVMFGYGRQACPGRFYALRLLKTVLGELILRYDIRYAGGHRPRSETLDLEPLLAPDSTV
ncbi:cytochrome P450 [Aspergillus californicus]